MDRNKQYIYMETKRQADRMKTDRFLTAFLVEMIYGAFIKCRKYEAL